MINRLLTRNYTKVPLLWVNFNYQLFKKNGKKNSCMYHVHPVLAKDENLKQMVGDIIDYIRDNYDMKDIL